MAMHARWSSSFPMPVTWSSSDPCDGFWTGVTCTGTIVTGIDLGYNLVEGILDPAVGKLTGLTTLVMKLGGAGGQLPSTLSFLTNLQTLVLQCPFSAVTGSIPPQLSVLTALTQLDFSRGNRIHGVLPQQLSTLTRLVYLVLANNLLSGVVPQQYSTLTSLVILDLRSNHLSGGLPSQLSTLTLLQALQLDHNILTGTLPPAMSSIYPHLDRSFVAGNAALCGSTAAFPGINTGATRLGQACPMPPRKCALQMTVWQGRWHSPLCMMYAGSRAAEGWHASTTNRTIELWNDIHIIIATLNCAAQGHIPLQHLLF